VISSRKVTGFYFWHDDFSVLYSARTSQCIFSWPYSSYCNIFSLLESIFGFSAQYYFLAGIILFVFSSLAFLFFARQLFNSSVSFFLAVIYSTAFYGGETFFEAYDAITAYSSLGFLFLSFGILIKSLSGKQVNRKMYFASLSFFVASLVVLHARSATYVVGYLLVLFLFSDARTPKKIRLAVLPVLFYLIFYLAVPLISARSVTGSGSLAQYLFEFNALEKIDFFLQNIGSILFTSSTLEIIGVEKVDFLVHLRRLTGGGLFLSFIYLTWTARKKGFVKTRIFALLLIGFLYIPYAVRSNWVFAGSHRYFLPTVPGLLVAWGTLAGKRVWVYASVALAIFSFIQANSMFEEHLAKGTEREAFYSQLQRELPSLPEGATIFFEFHQDVKIRSADFFRVGFTPSESSLGALYGVDYEKLTLLTSSDELRSFYSESAIDPERFFSFYYDGNFITNTTRISRAILENGGVIRENINLRQEFELVESREDSLTSGKTLEKEFTIEGLVPTLPWRVGVKMKADFPEIILPYTQGCSGSCDVEEDQLLRLFSYLSNANEFRRRTAVSANISGERTSSGNLMDNDKGTYWIVDRSAWYEETPHVLRFQSDVDTVFSGIVIYSSLGHRAPRHFLVSVDGREIDNDVSAFDSGVIVKLSNGPVNGRALELAILNPDSDDLPVLYEALPVSLESDRLDYDLVEKVENAPAAKISSEQELKGLGEYLASGAKACIRWKTDLGAEGLETLTLQVDGVERVYTADLPAMGTQSPRLSISCLDFPVEFTLSEVSAIFFGRR